MGVLSDPWSLRIPDLEGCHNLGDLPCRWDDARMYFPTERSDEQRTELVKKRPLTMMIVVLFYSHSLRSVF